jgi:arginine/lysine/ornithine decarboxylase
VLDHSGPVGESEAYVARIIGSHASYAVLNGTFGSNRAIFMACVGENQFALCDRNCHKSIQQGLVLSGGTPLYMTPTRNRFGIIGPILPEQFDPQRIAANHLACTTVQFHLGGLAGLFHLRTVLLKLLEQPAQLLAQHIHRAGDL